MADITMWNLPVSPNSMKVRIALNYKGLEYDRIDIDFADEERAEVVKVSGQPLAPVIKHRDAVVYDSRAILRYLDSNFRDTPPLLVTNRAAMLELENMENYARGTVGSPIGIIFTQLFAEEPDLAACGEASRLINEATADYEERLQSQDFLTGDRMSIVDVTAAPLVWYAMLPAAAGGPDNPMAQFFIDNYKLGEGRDKTREWVNRVMAYDR